MTKLLKPFIEIFDILFECYVMHGCEKINKSKVCKKFN